MMSANEQLAGQLPARGALIRFRPRRVEPVEQIGAVDDGAPALSRRLEREHRAVVRVRFVDFIVVATVVAAVPITEALGLSVFGAAAPDGLVFAAAVVGALWLIALSFFHTRAPRLLSQRSAQYLRVANATLAAFGLLAIVAMVSNWEALRAQLVFAMPAGLFALVVGRWACKYTTSAGIAASPAARAVVVGTRESVKRTLSRILADGRSKFDVVGVSLIDSADAILVVGDDAFQVLGNGTDIADVVTALQADTVILSGMPDNENTDLKHLCWQLEGKAAEVVLASDLVDIDATRISLDPVDGASFVHVALPTTDRLNVSKRAFDITAASLLILVLSPVLAAVALTVRLSSPGSIFYRQERVGRDGQPFHMLKFRSMREGADAELALLLASQGAGDTPLFKIKDDPRITPTGRILRKYSLDELPQLFNVLNGSMSLVGPRPQVAAEVALYEDGASRRLRTPPGITGLWQVSGRSSLTWDQAIRLDLYYVENWSLFADLVILLRTARAVFAPGATAH